MKTAERILIDAIEGMAPSSVHIEADEEGRARVVRLDLAPRTERIEAREAEDIAAAVQAACEAARVTGQPLSTAASAALNQCIEIIGEVIDVHMGCEREQTADRLAVEAGLLEPDATMMRRDARTARARQAWQRIRPALQALLGGTA